MISEAVIDSNISHDDFVSINNALKEFYNAKQEIKNSNNQWKFRLCIKQCCLIVWSVEEYIILKL